MENNRKYKKIGSILFIMLLLLVVPGCSAGKNRVEKSRYALDDSSNVFSNENRENLKIYYADYETELDAFESAVVSGDSIFTVSENEDGIHLRVYNKTDGCVIFENTISIEGERFTLLSAKNDNAYLVVSIENALLTYLVSNDGEITEIVSPDVGNVYNDFLKPNAVASIKGVENDYIWYEVYVKSSDSGLERLADSGDDSFFKTNKFFSLNGDIEQFCLHVPDQIMAYGCEGDNLVLIASGETGWYKEVMDRNGKVIEREELSEITPLYSALNYCSRIINDDIYYVKDGYILSYNLKHGICDKLAALSDFGIFQEEIVQVEYSEDCIDIITSEKYYHIIQGKSNKKVVYLAGAGFEFDPELQRLIAAYNGSNEDYYIKTIDYLIEGNDYEDAKKRFSLELISGNIPDIIMVNTVEDEMVYADKGIICDLYSLMDTDEFSKDKLIGSAIEPYEIDGCLYSVAPEFAIYTVVAKGSKMGTQNGLSFDEYRRILSENNVGPEAIYNLSFADEPDIIRLSNQLMDDFIDWNKMKCDFNDREFKELLRFVKAYREMENTGDKGLLQRITEGEIIASCVRIGNVSDYQIQKELFGEDICFIGYPTSHGTGVAVGSMGARLAITTKSDVKDVAGDFLKFYLVNYSDERGFSVVKDLFEKQLSEAQLDTYIIDEDGMESKIPKNYYFDSGTSTVVYAASSEDCDVIRSLVGEADSKYEYYPTVTRIIEEESESYFSGFKSEGDVAKIIQSRVQLMLNER